MVDLDDLSDALERGDVDVASACRAMRAAQWFVDEFLHGGGRFPPASILHVLKSSHLSSSSPKTSKPAQEVFGARAAYYVTSAAHTEQAVLDRVVELARPTPDSVALDVATGTGHTAFALAPHVGRVIGIDITPEMLDEARKLQAGNGISNVSFQLASADDLPFPDGTFDVVACRRAAHHFVYIQRSIAEMKRVLRPGGRLVVDDRSVPEDDFVDETMNLLDVLHDESHVREYRPSEWRSLLSDACLEVEVVETYTRHRPLSSLMDNVSEEKRAKILEVVTSLNEEQKRAMNLVEKDGQLYINHWFVIAVGLA